MHPTRLSALLLALTPLITAECEVTCVNKTVHDGFKKTQYGTGCAPNDIACMCRDGKTIGGKGSLHLIVYNCLENGACGYNNVEAKNTVNGER